jgi:(S)-ureidoglycine aminohydrolase
MTPKLIFVFCFISFFGLAQNAVQPGVYWLPDIKTGSAIMVKGSTLDLSLLEVSANILEAGKKFKIQVGGGEEHLLFIQSGSVNISLSDSIYTLGRGSVVMILPSEKYSLSNTGDKPCMYQVMKYQSKSAADIQRGKNAGGSFVRDWNKLTFKPHDRGGVRAYFDRPTALAKRFEMHVTSLKEGLPSHAPHTHRAEEFILVLEGNVEMLIGEKSFKGKAGDILFAPSNVLHGLKNDGAGVCSYFAFQWETF